MNSFDLFISSFLNGFAERSFRFDELVNWLSESVLFKGCVVMGIGCWLWFQNKDVQETREALLAAIMASFPALAVARVLSWVFNRTRPLIETRHLFRLPYGQTPGWEGPSSFPSDHAVLFFALATGSLLCLPTYRVVSLRICLDSHLPAPYLSGGALCHGHSRGCRDRSVHDVAGQHFSHPEASDRVGATIARNSPGIVLFLPFHRDLPNGRPLRSGNSNAQGGEANHSR